MPELDVAPVQFKIKATPSARVGVTRSTGAQVILVPTPGIQGPTGGTGAPGDGAQVFGAALTGAQNGTNAVFTTPDAYGANTTAVYRNGLRELRGVGYTESGVSEITFSTPPLSTDDISIDYVIE